MIEWSRRVNEGPDRWQAVNGNPDSDDFGHVAIESEDRAEVEAALRELDDDYELGKVFDTDSR